MKKANGKRRLLKNILIICVSCFIASSFITTFAHIQEYNDQITVLEKEIAKEKETNKKLKQKKNQIHSDNNYKDIARNTLGLVNPGDKVYVNSNDNNSK